MLARNSQKIRITVTVVRSTTIGAMCNETRGVKPDDLCLEPLLIVSKNAVQRSLACPTPHRKPARWRHNSGMTTCHSHPSDTALCTGVYRATLNELEPVAVLFNQYRQFYARPADLAQARTFIADRMARRESVIYAAADTQGTLAGFCQLYPSFCSVAAAPILVLYDLFVAPGVRRLGLAKALMVAAQRYATVQGVARMDLTTAHTNTKAQALYESLGWQLDTVFRAYTWTPPSPGGTA